ncbi:Mrp/NBP35 family ATP-binding protein [Evansella clarkii]|uniref:Mrp/NBP35 family ATP-binding protein n=1 Tax=Evansella clarkii TaxID=79879 RepID=UPI000997CDDD|nr:Mrp/NBP35 family ATP-binding protein [Evansella clarkii]
MITEEKVVHSLRNIKDPHLQKNLVDVQAIKELKIKENMVSLKLAIAQPGTADQMALQQQVVNAVKAAGAHSVGLRFEKMAEEVLAQLGGQAEEKKKSLLDRMEETTFIAVTSGKGGVGKSTVSVNIATALARKGKKVGIIDADIYGFSVPDMMGIQERLKISGQRVLPVNRFGVQVISMGFFVHDNSPIVWRGPMLGKMLNNFFSEVEWEDPEYVILDLPPGTGDVALDVHSMLPTTKEIIVTTPHPSAAFVAARAGLMAMRTGHEILGVIENMAYFESKATGEKEYIFGQGGAQKLANDLNSEVLAQIPLGQPEMDTVDFAPSIYGENHPTGKIYLDLAHKVISKTGK